MTDNKKSNKSIKAQVRFTPEEAAYIDTLAKKSGLDRSKWIRSQCLDPNVVITPETMECFETLKQIDRELAPIGNNINQIARTLNTARASNQELPLNLDEEFVWQLYSEIREVKSSIAMLIETNKPEYI